MANCSIYSAGKVPFGNFSGIAIWCYEAFDNSGSNAFRAGTVWGVSFPKLPDRLISQPRTVFSSILRNHVEFENFADDFAKDEMPHDNATYPVISRTIKETSNPNYVRICFIATSIENQGGAEENLIGVALTEQDVADPKLFVRVDAKLLMAPSFAPRKDAPPIKREDKMGSYFRAERQ